MKWLVFSDSHGHVSYMRRALEKESPDRVLHLGDMVRDGYQLQKECPGVPVEQVRGNCDSSGCGEPEERELFFGAGRVWMLHGHTYHVKLGMGLLASEAHTRGADVVLFGHTHQPLCCREGRLWIMNPGAIGGAAPHITYGVIELRNGELYCRTVQMDPPPGR